MGSWSDAERTVEFDEEAVLAPEPEERSYGAAAGAAGDEWLREDLPPHWESR